MVHFAASVRGGRRVGSVDGHAAGSRWSASDTWIVVLENDGRDRLEDIKVALLGVATGLENYGATSRSTRVMVVGATDDAIHACLGRYAELTFDVVHPDDWRARNSPPDSSALGTGVDWLATKAIEQVASGLLSALLSEGLVTVPSDPGGERLDGTDVRLREFAAALASERERVGLSVRRLADAIADLPASSGAVEIRSSSLGEFAGRGNRTRLPTESQLRTILLACGTGDDEIHRFVRERAEIAKRRR
jgi:hypothetical protein